jgi:uroporphyrinogen-III synthase
MKRGEGEGGASRRRHGIIARVSRDRPDAGNGETAPTLGGGRVLVTRPAEQAAPLAEALRRAGAIPLLYPTVTVGEPPDWGLFDAAFASLGPGDWVVFTSPSAVRLAVARLRGMGRFPAVAAAPIAAVGPGTAAALAVEGLSVALVPSAGLRDQDGLAAAMSAVPAGTRVIFPRALDGRDALARQLVARGVTVETVPVSQTRACALAPLPAFDAAVFASPSALRALLARWGASCLTDRLTVAIGPVTAGALRAAGITGSAVAADPTPEAIVGALRAAWAGRLLL